MATTDVKMPPLCLVAMCYILLHVCTGEVVLEHMDSLYVPYTYEPVAQYEMLKAGGEQSDYDSQRKIIFSVGGKTIHVIDAFDPANLHVLMHYDDHRLDDGSAFTDVAVCKQVVFASIRNQTHPEDGMLSIFRYNKQTNELKLHHSVTVGPWPDMVQPTKDCNTVFVALEGTAYVKDDVVVDPEAGFGIFRWDSTDASNQISYYMLDFTKFNPRTDDLVNRGVRFIYRENQNTLSRDLEPEFITLNDEETLAYVCLQENNAIAVVNITNLDTADVIDIYPLGFKSWMDYTMDPSDKDGAKQMKNWPVYGILQPDNIAYFRHNGIGYIFTANEGDSKEFYGTSGLIFSEESRGNKILSYNFSSVGIDNVVRGYLSDDSQLGRLKFQLPPESESLDTLYSYGGRSFSMLRASDMKMMYDSGDVIEQSIRHKYPALFNCDSQPELSPWDGADFRSDDKGPECESLVVGRAWDKTLVFVGNERPGTISVFSIDDDSNQPRHESINFAGTLRLDRTWNGMYHRRSSGDVDPESLRFISAEESSIGEPLLMVTGDVSGTVSIYLVKMNEVVPGSDVTSTIAAASPTTAATLVQVCTDSQMKCRNTNRCVSVKYKCDGVDDCGDNTDEADCTSEDLQSQQMFRLTIAIVCLTSVTVLILIVLYCLLHDKDRKKNYEMSSNL